MTDDEFDANLVDAAFALGGDVGWRKVSAAAAARHAGLDLSRARSRFADCGVILRKFGALSDAYAMTGALQEGSVKDGCSTYCCAALIFCSCIGLGVIALLRAAPLNPLLGGCLAKGTLVSMGWILEAAGVSAQGIRGEIRKRGLAAVWAWGVRAWVRDESTDLSATMAAVDVALARADQIASRFERDGFTAEAGEPESTSLNYHWNRPPGFQVENYRANQYKLA